MCQQRVLLTTAGDFAERVDGVRLGIERAVKPGAERRGGLIEGQPGRSTGQVRLERRECPDEAHQIRR